MKKYVLLISCVLGISWSGFSQNINISTYAFHDMEPYIAVNPTNPNHVVAAWMKLTGIGQITIAVSKSVDGGTTYSSAILLPHLSATFTHADVSFAFNNSGKLFMSYIDHDNASDSGYVMVANSVDGGNTWSTPVAAISLSESVDKPIDRPWLEIDRSGGAYNGRLYLTSKSVEGFTPYHVWFKYSNDDGATWSTLQQIDSVPTGSIMSMGNIAVGNDGNVYVAYLSWDLASSLYVRALLVKSTNGGVSFAAPTVIGNYTSSSTINDTLQFSSTLSINPTDNQNLIFTFTDGRNGDADILSTCSTNGGTSWSTPVRVNNDILSNGVQQDMSWAGFAPNGTYMVAWRDRRNAGTYAVSPFEIMLAASTNGGVSFSSNSTLSNVPSPDIPIAKGNDFIGIGLSNTHAFVNWCDNRTGNYEIFTDKILLAAVTVPEQNTMNKISITVFPNPAKSYLTVHVNGLTAKTVKAYIINTQGKTVYTFNNLVTSNETLELPINNLNLVNGSYVFKLETTLESIEQTFVIQR